MKNIVSGLALLFALSLVPLTASAADEKPFVISARAGIVFPLGGMWSSSYGTRSSMTDWVSAGIPIQLDLGYFVIPNLMLGAYGTYSPLFANNCADGASCGADTFKIGIQAQYWFLPKEFVNPWLGLGFGYEWASFRQSASAAGITVSNSGGAKGFEFVTIQGGADFKVDDAFSLGPYASFALGQYDTGSNTFGGVTNSQDIREKALHEWLTLGVRANFRF